MSPQHTVTAIVGLMKATNCTRILTTPTSRDRIADQVTNVLSNVQTQLLPTLDELFPYLGHESTADSFQPFKLPITEAKPDDIYLYLHSSGSTGIPKPIAQTRRVMSCWCDRGTFLFLSRVIFLADSLFRSFRQIIFDRGPLTHRLSVWQRTRFRPSMLWALSSSSSVLSFPESA